ENVHPRQPRTVLFLHPGLKLAGKRTLRGDETPPVTVQLGPWASVRGRAVDADGQPIAKMKLGFYPGYRPAKKPASEEVAIPPTPPGTCAASSTCTAGPVSLPPGPNYSAASTTGRPPASTGCCTAGRGCKACRRILNRPRRCWPTPRWPPTTRPGSRRGGSTG